MDISDLIKNISNIITHIRPEIIYMNNRGDIHTDHQVAAKAIMSCVKSFRYPFIKRILMYECISETEMAPGFPENIFIPNVYSDITDYINEKIEIMKIYESELQIPPLPRSLDNIASLARFRVLPVEWNMQRHLCLLEKDFEKLGDIMKKIVLVGGGGHCKVIIDIIRSIAEYEITGITGKHNIGQGILGIPVIGDDEILKDLRNNGVTMPLFV